MSENVQEASNFGLPEGEIQESEELGIVSGATKVHENAPPYNPAVPMMRASDGVERMSDSERIQSGSGHRDVEADKNPEGRDNEEGEKADEHVEGKEGEEGKQMDVKTGGKRQRPAVKVQKGEEEGETGKEAKKAKVAEKKKPQAKRQAKTQAKAKIQETAPKKRGPGRPRKSSGTNKKVEEIDVEGEQKLDAVETSKAVN